MRYYLDNAFLQDNPWITVVGCGGTGGYVAEGLCRLFTGREATIVLVDHDRVEPHPGLSPMTSTGRGDNDPWSFTDRASGVPFRLEELETYEKFLEANPFGGFTFSQLAAELLAAHAGEGSLLRFYGLLEPERTWQEAFQLAFSVTVEEFYELFEAHRAAGFPEVELPVA